VKTIDLCGLGNGLVDLQYEMPDSDILEIGLKKGEMRLVENIDQDGLLKKLEGKSKHICSGGSAANTVIAFSSFGGTCAYKTVLGKDEFGDFYKNEFNQLGIKLIAPQIENEPTGTCIVLISPDSERTMNTSLAATSHFGPEHISEEYIANAKWIYLEGYKFTKDKSTAALFKAAELAKKHDTKIALTFSDVFITETFKENLDKIVAMSDLLFCNEAEAMSYTKTNNVEDAFTALCNKAPNVVVTKGAKGSAAFWDGKIYEFPSYPASPKDSTGAGDMFAAGFLYGIICLNSPEQAGHLASLSAAKVVSQFGARLKEDHVALKNQILETIK
jgi:sugar/nucleoside kinase (ribokinase family)